MDKRIWPEMLESLPGLSAAERGKARVKLLRMPCEQAELLVSGLPDVAAEAIREILLKGAAAGPGSAGAAAADGGATAPVEGPDTSQEYMRRVLMAPGPSGATADAAASHAGLLVAAGSLDQPLGAKLPVHGGLVQTALSSSSELQEYVVVAAAAQPQDRLAASAHRLCLMMTAALDGLCDYPLGVLEGVIALRMGLLVDVPLSFAASSLALDWRMERNTADQSARLRRPSFLFWVSNVLLFTGLEKAHASELQAAVMELQGKIATLRNPALLPGVNMPCMFAYAAAGSTVRFFAITSRGGAVELAPVSGCLDISTPLGRIKVVHHTLKVLQALAAYAPHAP